MLLSRQASSCSASLVCMRYTRSSSCLIRGSQPDLLSAGRQWLPSFSCSPACSILQAHARTSLAAPPVPRDLFLYSGNSQVWLLDFPSQLACLSCLVGRAHSQGKHSALGSDTLLLDHGSSPQAAFQDTNVSTPLKSKLPCPHDKASCSCCAP